MSKFQLNYVHQFSLTTLIAIFLLGCAEEITPPGAGADACFKSGPLTISNLSAVESKAAVKPNLESLAIRKQVFVDRTNILYTDVSPDLVGLPYIQTANDDKQSDANNPEFLTFSVNTPVLVRVAIDSRVNPTPSWLNGWEISSTVVVKDNDQGIPRIIYQKAFSDCEIQLGGNGGSDQSSMYSVIIEDLSGSIPSDPATTLVANDDNNVTTTLETPVNIKVLDNDTSPTPNDFSDIEVSIDSRPAYGVANVETDKSITYIPETAFVGTDSIVYRISDSLNRTDTATVSIRVTCVDCAANKSVDLSWTANPSADSILGYNIYRGPSETQVDALLEQIPVNQPGFSVTNPAKSYNAGTDLNLRTGDRVCFKLSAYNASGESALSSPFCAPI